MAEYSEADIYNSVETPQGKYFKLKDGDTAQIRIFSNSSNALIYQRSYTNKKTGEINISNRFAYVIWNHDAKKAQVWSDVSGSTYDKLKKLITNPQYGDITQYDIFVTREGEELQTKYEIVPARANSELKPGAVVACRDIDLMNEVQRGEGVSHIMTLADYHLQSKEGRKEFLDQHNAEKDYSKHPNGWDGTTKPEDEPLPEPPEDV